MEKILLTGEPQGGKSTVVEQVFKNYSDRIVGIVAQEMKGVDEKRQGFNSKVFGNPNKMIFAHVDIVSPVKVGKYGVDVMVLDEIAQMLSQQMEIAINQKKVLIFDEIGLMQTYSRNLRIAIEQVIESDVPSILTIKQDVSESDWLKKIKSQPDLIFLTINPGNRQQVLEDLSSYVERSHE